VQDVSTTNLRELLRNEGAVLDAGYQPQVTIAWTPEHPRPGEPVHFSVVAGELREPIAQTWWDFDGNGTVSAETGKANHTFALDKTYNVSLVVADKAGRRRMVAAEVPVGAALGRDVTVDEFDAELAGRWEGAYPQIIRPDHSRTPDVFLGPGVHFDVARGVKAPARARFQPPLSRAGRYQVCLAFRPATSQATNVPVTVRHSGGTERLTINQRDQPGPLPFVSLGEFQCKAGASSFVEITNSGTDGRVAVDGVRWVWLGE